MKPLSMIVATGCHWHPAKLVWGFLKNSDDLRLYDRHLTRPVVKPGHRHAPRRKPLWPAACADGTERGMQFPRITTDPRRMNGQPCVRDLRITVRRVLEIIASCPDRATIRSEYPELEDEDIVQALGYAATLLEDAVIELPKAG
jgi:uncharacterized protein (DUF433 family)